MPTKKLTQKQFNFVNNYVTNGFNAHQAALDAGYSQKYAEAQSYNLVNHPAISERLSNAYKEAEKVTEISFQWIIDKHVQTIRAFEKSPLAQDARVVIAALSELAKMKGFYAPDKRVSLTVDATQKKLDEVRKVYDEY